MAIETDRLVIGAGPAGLARGFWRTRDGADCRVVDQAPEPGGWVQTRRIEGYVCEHGPQGMRPSEVSDAFLEAAGLTGAVVPCLATATARFIARDGQLHELPQKPGQLLRTGLFTLRGKFRLLRERWVRAGGDPDESLAAFVHRRFGPQAVPLAEAMTAGIFGGDAHALELAAAFPTMAELESVHGSVLKALGARRRSGGTTEKRPTLSSFTGGMHTLAEALRRQLGSRLLLGRPAVRIERSGARWRVTLGGGVETEVLTPHLEVATPAQDAAKLFAPVDAELAAALAGIPFASIANIYLGFQGAEPSERLQGFGFLLDRRERSEMLGAIYCSSILPGTAPDNRFLVRIMAGGALHPGTVERDEEDLAREAEAMLRSYTGLRAPLAFRRVYKAMRAIPQYERGHGQRVATIRARAHALGGLEFLGNSYDEVSVVGQLRRPAAAASATSAAPESAPR